MILDVNIWGPKPLVGNCRNMVSWKKSFLHKHFQQSFHLWNTCNIVFPNHLPDMVFQSLVYGMEQTCRLKNTKCIKSTWLQKSQSIYDYPDHVSILTYDWSHHPATRSCLYTVILQEKSSSSYPDNVSILTYDRRSHHPAIRIISLYYHMTGEGIIQLPGSCFYTDIWLEKSSSSYPDNVSMQSYDRRSCNPATRILSLYCHMTGEAIIRILSLYCHMTWEVIIQLPG